MAQATKKSALSCSEALHAIGQDLERRGIKTFLVRCERDLYVVEAGYQPPPAPTPVTLHYTENDIEQLDREGRERSDPKVKDFLSLPQILWAIGSSVTSKGAKLLTISNNTSTETMPVVKIEYETAQGVRVVDDRTGSAIYELSLAVYKLRGPSRINHDRQTRFHGLRD